MAQNEESIKSQTKSPDSHLPCVTCPDNSISSFDLLNSCRPAAIFLKATTDSQNPRKSMTLPSVSPLSTSTIKQRCPSPPDGDNASSAAAAAAASLISRLPCQHSPTTSSKIQAAFVMAMAASSPPSTCPSSSSSGHQGEHGTNDFRSDTQSSLGALFRPPPPTAFETVDGGGNGAGDIGFPPPGSGTLPSFVPFTNSSGASPDISASTCLTNAMLFPASIVNVLGQQMQSNQYHQPQSPAYLSTINTNSGGGFSQQSQQQQSGPQGGGGGGAGSGEVQAPPSLFRSVAGAIPPPQPPPIPSAAGSTDTGRYSTPGRSASGTLHEDTNNKREQRLLKNREAARECRRKKKEYVRCLERQVAILQDQNRQLIEELQKMKALCAGAFLDSAVQQTQLHNPPGLSNDRRLGGGGAGSEGTGMDFVDSAPSAPSAAHHHHHPHRKPPLRLPSPQPTVATSDSSGGNANSFHAPSEMDAESSASRPVSSELTLLKSPDLQTQQRLLLHGLSALKEGGVGAAGGGSNSGLRKGEENNYSSGAWMSSLTEQKPKFPDDEMDNRPPSSSPHIHPVKRVLKRFGNEQHRLSQLQKQQQQQQQSAGKPDPDKSQ
ncbi:cyclic AMP responsive element binding protein [Echinococcus multilocularis]|uniref:Cyclic AMP responsive element binding protein n=1 Tax=Echinococcus multilocularis TaxID=6211 RepID=A0A068YGS4_ECHMU|nr:cyclic AMP responsive element binding protein [Echinococcus multilocularis]